MECLPNEILQIIIQKLDNIDDMVHLGLTCKRLIHAVVVFSEDMLVETDKNYHSKMVLKIFKNLKYCYMPLRVKNYEDLSYLSSTKLKEVHIHIPSEFNTSILKCANMLYWNGFLENRSVKITKYNYNKSEFEVICFGDKNYVLGDSENLLKFLIWGKHFIEHICIDNIIFNYETYIDKLSDMEVLNYISYVDCGWEPMSALELFFMLNLKQNMKGIRCIPTKYNYEIDLDKRLDEIDDFLQIIIGEHPKIEELILPMFIDDVYDLRGVFPNLKSVNVRCFYEFEVEDFIIDSKEKYKVSFNELVEKDPEIDKLVKMYPEVSIFLYSFCRTKKARQHLCRHPEAKFILNKKLKKRIYKNYPNIRVIDMVNDPVYYENARDNEIFSKYIE